MLPQIDGQTKLVVANTDVPQLLNNKIFDPIEAVKVSQTFLPMVYLYNKALERGIRMVTSDVFLGLSVKPKVVLLFSSLFTPDSQAVIDAGAKPSILICGESPFVATRFYLGLKKISSQFTYSMVFSGMKKRLSKKTQFKTMYFPESFRERSETIIPFTDKKFLVMACSAKGSTRLLKSLLLKIYYGWGVREINSERRKAVVVFANQKGFDLFGRNWDKDKALDQKIIANCYFGPTPYTDKAASFSKYKFSLCFENSVFPGYVTEKILDSMAANCVPVYFGAPDITDFISPGCFIDASKFKTYEQLNIFLQSMDEKTYQNYIENIRLFFNSEQYKKFSQESYAKTVLDLLEKEFTRYG